VTRKPERNHCRSSIGVFAAAAAATVVATSADVARVPEPAAAAAAALLMSSECPVGSVEFYCLVRCVGLCNDCVVLSQTIFPHQPEADFGVAACDAGLIMHAALNADIAAMSRVLKR
jgi:hypothetical protein